jgi:hypothetical protein
MKNNISLSSTSGHGFPEGRAERDFVIDQRKARVGNRCPEVISAGKRKACLVHVYRFQRNWVLGYYLKTHKDDRSGIYILPGGFRYVAGSFFNLDPFNTREVQWGNVNGWDISAVVEPVLTRTRRRYAGGTIQITPMICSSQNERRDSYKKYVIDTCDM